MASINMQSNAIRNQYLADILDKTINEIHDDISTVFGPWACDAFITKDGQPYYTRDGLEVLESLTFDNQLAEYIRKMIYQAAYDQGKKVGDGTTSMIMIYTNLIRALRIIEKQLNSENPDVKCKHLLSAYNAIRYATINDLREDMAEIADLIEKRLKDEYVVPLNESRLFAMLYTCTQDKEFSAKVFTKLKDPLLAGAYIIPKKSNIESDLEFESYMNPLIKAVRHFTLRPIKPMESETVILHCNGMLDIAHMETFYGLATIGLSNADNQPLHPNIVILCNGLTDVTRKSAKQFIKYIKEIGTDISNYNNVAIYTLTGYRELTSDMIEDLSTIITDELGIGGLVNDITFESLLYQAFGFNELHVESMSDLGTFDCDLHNIDKMRQIMLEPYPVVFDDAEGLRLMKDLGPVAQKRYDDLIHEIEVEKSEVRKYQLQKRLRTVYGQFIEVEVGSKLLKDSQRKFELLLDVIISAAEAVRNGVLENNSIVLVLEIMNDLKIEFEQKRKDSNTASIEYGKYNQYASILQFLCIAVTMTIYDMLSKTFDIVDENDIIPGKSLIDSWTIDNELFDPGMFNVNLQYKNLDNQLCSISDSAGNLFSKPEDVADIIRPTYKTVIDGNEVEIPSDLVEPVDVIVNIMRNATLALELYRAETFHVDGFMQNYI